MPEPEALLDGRPVSLPHEDQLLQANRELQRRISELQALLDVLPVGIGIAADRECRDIRTNRVFAATLGLSPDANASKTAPAGERPTNFRVVGGNGTEIADDDLPMQRAAREGCEIRELELDIVHQDGRVVHLLEYATPLFDEAGQPRGAVGAFVDVTERTRLTQTLREEVEIRTTLAQVGAALASELDPDKVVEQVTDAGTKLTTAEFGAFFYNSGTAPGESYLLYSLAGAIKTSSNLPQLKTTPLLGPTFRGDGTLRLDDVTMDPRSGQNGPFDGLPIGHLTVRSYLALPVVRRSGEVLGALFFGHSRAGVFTAHHEQIAAGIAAWAAIALDNAKLHQDLERANRLKDEFLATLSHELRTPLNAVLGWAHMLRTGAVKHELQSRALESLERNAKSQAQLVEDLLDVSRIVSGGLQIKVERVSLSTVVGNALDTIKPAAAARRVTLDVAVDQQTEIVVMGDADRLQQVVWNLLANAVKFTPPGGRVELALDCADGMAEIVVSDSGQGISPEFQPFLFQRFHQEDSTPSRKHGGLGLGLSIVRHFVEAHGGEVHARSEGRDRGATFVVRLPVVAVTRRQASGAPRRAQTKVPLLTMTRVLVVDDEPDTRDLMQFVLEHRGAQVVTAASVREALDLIVKQSFDVLVADIGMPDHDGYELIRAVRSLAESERAHVPAVAVTAYANARERDQALEAGFDSHAAKPLDPDDLVMLVAEAARKRPGW